MDTEKIKVRVSDFVSLIIQNDAAAFGFIKVNGEPNINAFLNKLIPNLLFMRKYRRSEIHDTIGEAMEFHGDVITQEHIRSYIDTVIDKVYFSDSDLDRLNSFFWIRPNRNTKAIFDEIAESETAITGLDTSTCIRSLLNEYSHFPQYKRESITFMPEYDDIDISYRTDRILHLRYEGKKYRVVVMETVYGFLFDQHNYIICYDIKANTLNSFYLSGISDTYVVEKKHPISEKLIHVFQKYLDEEMFRDHKLYPIEESV